MTQQRTISHELQLIADDMKNDEDNMIIDSEEESKSNDGDVIESVVKSVVTSLVDTVVSDLVEKRNGNDIWECHICGRILKSKWNLKCHKRTHESKPIKPLPIATRKYRLYPTKQQSAKLMTMFAAARWTYNEQSMLFNQPLHCIREKLHLVQH
jgi:hypothetical protein